MALSNNLVLSLKDHPALAEALAQRQPGDRLSLSLEVTLVENLPDRAAFDVESVGTVDGQASGDDNAEDAADEVPAGAGGVLAASVLGVMKKKRAL